MILSRETRVLHRAERAEFLKTLHRVGPDAPTLCDGWQARTLAAHIVVAEQQAGLPMTVAYPLWRVVPAAVAGAMQSRLNGPMLSGMARAQGRGWGWLLGRLEAGPPRSFALRMVANMRLVEEWIHHEDVRRANGDSPRAMDRRLADALVASMLTIRSFKVFAASRDGIEAVLPDGSTYRAGTGPVKVRVAGEPGEVLLWLAGRGAAAQVDVSGEVAPAALRV